jgi:hypothetical protein
VVFLTKKHHYFEKKILNRVLDFRLFLKSFEKTTTQLKKHDRSRDEARSAEVQGKKHPNLIAVFVKHCIKNGHPH